VCLVVTDSGNVIRMIAAEIEEAFYPAQFVCDPERHPGVVQARMKGNLT